MTSTAAQGARAAPAATAKDGGALHCPLRRGCGARGAHASRVAPPAGVCRPAAAFWCARRLWGAARRLRCAWLRMASIWQRLEGLSGAQGGAALLLDVEGGTGTDAALEPLLGAPRSQAAGAAGRPQGTNTGGAHLRVIVFFRAYDFSSGVRALDGLVRSCVATGEPGRFGWFGRRLLVATGCLL